jgi:hypothetical protein
MTTIKLNKRKVKNRNDPLGAIWWRGKQWAVTGLGLECREGSYLMRADQLDELRDCSGSDRHEHRPDWFYHMADEEWVDLDDFATAFMVALVLHNRSLSFTSETLRATIGDCFARRALDDAFQKFVVEREQRDGICIRLAHLAELSDEFDRQHGGTLTTS